MQPDCTVKEKARQFVELLERQVEIEPLKEKRIIGLIERGIGRFRNAGGYHVDTYERFCDSLLLDGFVVENNLKLLSHTPEPASISPQISKLEQNWISRGF